MMYAVHCWPSSVKFNEGEGPKRLLPGIKGRGPSHGDASSNVPPDLLVDVESGAASSWGSH